VASFAERPAKNADRAEAAARFGNGWSNRSASRGIHPEQTNRQSAREYTTAEQTNAESRERGALDDDALLRDCGLERGHFVPGKFCRIIDFDVIAFFESVSRATRVFELCAKFFFESSA